MKIYSRFTTKFIMKTLQHHSKQTAQISSFDKNSHLTVIPILRRKNLLQDFNSISTNFLSKNTAVLSSIIKLKLDTFPNIKIFFIKINRKT